MANTKTTYIDKNGVKQTGYIKDSGIYSDFLKSAANDSNGIYSAMLQKNAEDVQGQIDRLNGQYEQLNTQLYRDYMTRKKNMPQQLAAQGISGGLSETSLLGLEAGYQDGLNQNERARINGIRDIQTAGDNAQLSILQDYWKDAAERANTMASIGDFSGYKALGYTDEQIAALKAAWDAQHAPKVRARSYEPTVKLGTLGQAFDKSLQNLANGTAGTVKASAVLSAMKNRVDRGLMSWEEQEYLLDKYGY